MRRSAPLLAVVAAAVLGLILFGPWAWAAEPASPTVTFTATGIVPLSCGSRPDVSSLTVPEGTSFIVANDIGISAWVRVGTESVLELPTGSGVMLMLAVGQHEVRLAPKCVITALNRAQAVTVTVTAAAPEAPPSASPPAAPASAPPPSAPASAPTSAPPGSAPPASAPGQLSGSPGSVIDVPAGATATPLPASGGQATAAPNGSPDPAASPADGGTVALGRPAVITATEVDLGGRNPKDVRLLAIIATICVLGVTAAVIRSIVRLSP